ncbi:MAG TPA: helix-turn-helix domain-containing protein [Pyrinomonadaceae bacterium]|nr:helix-turn-helix domain-containing protein [Pyrinomonadaceae bacterium]
MGQPVLTVPEMNTCGCLQRAEDSDYDCLCSATGLLQIIGRKFALRMLFLIGARAPLRFTEIKNELDDISTSTLSIRLAELEKAGLIERQMFPEIPPRVEYKLTPDGEKFRKSLFAISKFASRR